nr:MAG TPA: hypothetical protein [Bacteriophage sp.]
MKHPWPLLRKHIRGCLLFAVECAHVLRLLF